MAQKLKNLIWLFRSQEEKDEEENAADNWGWVQSLKDSLTKRSKSFVEGLSHKGPPSR